MKILLAIDSSSASQDVIAEAAARPWPSGTRFCVLHIVDVVGMGRFSTMIDEENTPAKLSSPQRPKNWFVPGTKGALTFWLVSRERPSCNTPRNGELTL